MGYYMFAYGVNTPEIEAVFGSKNEALLAEVQKNEIFQNYAEGDDNNETTKALTDIIMGYPFDEKKGYTYGYAFIGICATLGRELPFTEELKFWYETELINQALMEDYNIEVEIETMIDEDDEEKGFAYEHIMGLKENIAFCLSNQLDMIAFCH